MKRLLALCLLIAASAFAQDYMDGAGTGRPVVVSGATTPTVRSVVALSGSAPALTFTLPVGLQNGDLIILACNTSGGQAITATGYTATGSSPNDGIGTRTSVFTRVSDGADGTVTSDSGDHQCCSTIAIQTGTFNAASPVETTNFNDQGSATVAVSISGVTTSTNNTRVFYFSTSDDPDAAGTSEFSTTLNASLTDVTEHITSSCAAGGGGSLFIGSGILASAGASGAMTTVAATLDERANISIAIAAP